MPLSDIPPVEFPEIAAASGLSVEQILDFAGDKREAANRLSVRQLCDLASVVERSPMDLLGVRPKRANRAGFIDAVLFSAVLEYHIKAAGTTIEEFEEAVGWEIADFLEEPESMYDRLPWVGLCEVARGVAVDPVRLLPTSPARPAEASGRLKRSGRKVLERAV